MIDQRRAIVSGILPIASVKFEDVDDWMNDWIIVKFFPIRLQRKGFTFIMIGGSVNAALEASSDDY